MKPVADHRLAASELIKSAKFYERRNPTLGEAFLSEDLSVNGVEQFLSRRSEPAFRDVKQVAKGG